jgi:Xaa-Pro aminopeptidase
MEAELVGLGLIDAKAASEQGPDKALVKKYFMHGTSHHMGLDVHDVAPPHQAFAEGMVFTIEPGIYLQGRFGVRLEEVAVVTADGARRLSRLPRDLHVAG